jgi:photosystem II stability/assembly factor-like uncharacterized protein
MTNTKRSLWTLLLIAFLCSIVALSGTTPSKVKAQATSSDDDDDPDLPRIARGRISKDLYLDMRDAYVNRLRGIPYDKMDARVQAIREMETQERENAPDINSTSWTSIGPAPIPNGQTSPSTAVSGRTIAIAVHPTNANIVYVGTAQGGVYRSTDGGTTWVAIFDSALSLAVGAIAIAPSDPTTVFVGTGEPNFSCDSFSGVGVYRITTADTTPVLAGPFNLDGGMLDVMTGRAVGKILVHPTDPNTIFVSTTTGIGGIGCDLPSAQPSRGLFRSTNALSGTPTFTKLTVATANAGNRSITDAVLEPGTPNNLVCAVVGFNGAGDGGIYRSTNALAVTPTFTRTLTVGSASSTFRTELAMNKVGMVVTVYAAIGEPSANGTCNGVSQSGTLKKSTDGGATWSAAIAAGDGFCGGQCSYDIMVAVDPNDASKVLLGGNVNSTCSRLAARSTNGGTSFTSASSGVHADNHVAAFAPSDPSVAYMGTDGGIYKTTDGGASWTTKSNTGFNATQFMGLALHPTDREFMIGGTQDNGTEFRRPDATWTRADFGDGGFALIDQGAVNTTTVTMYHTYFNQTGNLIGLARVNTSACATEGQWAFRGIFGGAPDPTPVCDGSAGEVFNGININDNVEFYAPIALGPGTPNTLYFGTDRLYRSINKGDTMSLVSQAPIEASQTVTTVGISPQNDNVRIVGLSNGHVYATTTGSNPLTNVTGTIAARYVAKAAIDPTNVNTAYVTLAGFGLAAGQHVWKTTNLNAVAPTWNAAGTGIPDVPVNAFVVDPANTMRLYAGTDIGVYRSTDGGTTWTPFSNGLPRVAVFDMAIQSTFKVLRIATHGRGIWEISLLPKPTPYNFDNDGKSDLSVFRPSSGTWFITNSSTGTTTSVGWGVSGDQIAPGDYDGDSKTDIAVWRPSTGVWFIINSSNGSTTSTGWGVGTDIPVPGDYDGDGKTDIAVWRPSSGTWFIINSSNGSTTTPVWGVSGDLPAAGDYDGDGKTDLAVFRPSAGTWFILRSSNGTTQSVGWGVSGDKVVQGDYDGDGKTDIAVWRPSTGVWFIINSSNGTTTTTGWGVSTDIPVPGDYDGDGKIDISVWRPASGTWFIINSSNGSTTTPAWGVSGDVPVPSAFVRP